MGKADPFKDKPKPPNFGQIKEDLLNAPKTDVVFELTLKDCPYITNLTPETSNSSNTKATQFSKSASEDKGEELEDMYNKVTKMIDLHERLLSEPDNLSEKYELLKQLGKDVSESIAQLKSSAETVGKKEKNRV